MSFPRQRSEQGSLFNDLCGSGPGNLKLLANNVCVVLPLRLYPFLIIVLWFPGRVCVCVFFYAEHEHNITFKTPH